MPPVRSLLEARTRHLPALATLPWVLSWPLLGSATGGDVMTGHSPYGRVMWAGFSILGADLELWWRAHHLPVGITTPAGAVVAGYAGIALAAIFMVTGLGVAVGWSRLWRGVWRAPGTSHHLVAAAFVPALSLAVVVALWLAQIPVIPHRWVSSGGRPPVPIGWHQALAHLLGDVVTPAFFLSLAVSVACVALAPRRVPIPPNDRSEFSKSNSGIDVVYPDELTVLPPPRVRGDRSRRLPAWCSGFRFSRRGADATCWPGRPLPRGQGARRPVAGRRQGAVAGGVAVPPVRCGGGAARPTTAPVAPSGGRPVDRPPLRS